MTTSFNIRLEDLESQETISASVGRNHVNITPDGKAIALKTTQAVDPEPQRSISTWSASDILQGAANQRPLGAQYDVFNQTASSDLSQILGDNGGPDATLGGRTAIAPYDVVASSGSTGSGVQSVVDVALGTPGGSNVRTEPSVNGEITVADVTNGAGGTTTVAQSIAGSIQELYDAAKADGIAMGGWGYRSHQRQIELRTINGCPDVWTASPSSCATPTAIPGKSKHESGLAIDFTQNGSTLSRSASGFNWMVANAAKYGLKNLPSEPWHWSTDGG